MGHRLPAHAVVDSHAAACYTHGRSAGVAQLVERYPPKVEVASSSLVARSSSGRTPQAWFPCVALYVTGVERCGGPVPPQFLCSTPPSNGNIGVNHYQLRLNKVQAHLCQVRWGGHTRQSTIRNGIRAVAPQPLQRDGSLVTGPSGSRRNRVAPSACNGEMPGRKMLRRAIQGASQCIPGIATRRASRSIPTA